MSQITESNDLTLEDSMLEMGQRARAASTRLGTITAEQRTTGLNAMADALEAAESLILDANGRDNLVVQALKDVHLDPGTRHRAGQRQ